MIACLLRKLHPATPASKEYHVASFCFPRILSMVKKTAQQIWTKDFPHFEVAQKNIVFLGGLPLFLTPNPVERWHKIRGESLASVKQPETGMQFQTELSNFFLIKIINYWEAISNSKGVSQGPFIEVYEL